MKLQIEDCLLSVKDVHKIVINIEKDTYSTQTVKVHADPSWGLFQRVWYSVRSYLFGYPTKVEKVLSKAPKKWWVLSMDYMDEQDQGFNVTISHEKYEIVKKQYDAIMSQLPYGMINKVNQIMFEDDKT